MEGTIVQGPIGTVGAYEVKFEAGNLVISATEKDALGETSISRKVGAKAVLEALKKAIPGTVDDAVFSLIETALGL